MLDHIASALLRSSLEGGFAILMVWAVCRLVPHTPPRLRVTLWWLAALKLVVSFAWVAPLEVAVLPPATAALAPESIAVPAARIVASDVSAPASLPARSTGSSITRASRIVDAAVADTAGRAAALLWLGCSLAWVAVSWRQWRRTRALIRRATPAPRHLQQLADTVAARLGMSRGTDVRESREVDTPQVAGLARPVVLLPSASFHRLSCAEQQMAICHELVHVRRRDLWLGVLPACAERLFFFHPLAHVAAREYVIAREAACDAEVLDVLDASPKAYGRLLLTLGTSRRGAILTAAGAPCSPSNLKRRLSMLRTHTSHTRRRAGVWTAATLAGCLMLSIGLVARPDDTRARPAQPATPARAAASGDAVAPVLAGAAALPLRAARAAEARPVRGPVRPAPDGAALVPVLADDPAPARQKTRSLDPAPWVLFKAGDRQAISGSGQHRAAAERHRRGSEAMLWFQRGGTEYVVRDTALLQQIEAAFKPLGALGEQMGAIGGKQGALGGRQGELGAKQGELGAKQGLLGAEQARLGARQAALGARRASQPLSDGERAEIEKESAALEAEMAELSRKMEALGREMEKLAEPMDALGREMEAHGKVMEDLGKKMEAAAAEAEATAHALMEKAIASGLAQEVR